LRQNAKDGRLRFVEGFVSTGGGLHQFSGIGKHVEPFAGKLGFARLGIGSDDFGVLEAEQIQPLGFSLVLSDQVGELGFGRLSLREDFTNCGGQRGRVGIGIDEQELTAVVEQGLLLVLTVDIE
jgi:hypothetical protein